MTRIQCDFKTCKSNKEGVCTKEEISLDHCYNGEVSQANYVLKCSKCSSDFIVTDFKHKKCPICGQKH